MNNYKKFNNITGWLVFLIAAVVYTLTIEPTASFWDCGEFIATAFKLEVGHPPGAPFFMLIARVFILFAGGDLTKVPVMVNMISALASAFTILFLFWTITAMAKKLVWDGKEELTTAKLIAIMGAGAVGALGYTFSDSFWFSSAEGEVYAMSSLFTAVVFWAILKWENVADEKHSSRWIIFIAYMMGLSIGVHLLNLLTIPALAFVYYFRKHKPTTKGFILTSILSVLILGTIQGVIIPGVVKFAAKFELLFVNSLGMGFGSGVFVYLVLVVGGLIYGLYITHKKGKVMWNTVILSVAFILIGYSTFTMVVIRSMANPPMDENNPENVFTLLSYLNREQYGDRPLISGQYYNAKVVDETDDGESYSKGKDKYIITGKKTTPIYDPANCTVFPRMYSNQSNHIYGYKQWAEIKGDAKPTLMQNLRFFMSYQVNFMYWRYFMWNFAGRQNDIQGEGNIKEGNWISGIQFIDAMRLGPQDKLPKSMTDNKGMNRFYFLPLIMGLLGLFFQYKRDDKDAFVVFLLFLLTGLAIVIYLNQTPYQPRERDYAYAGSFYAFAIWIGLGVLAIADFLQKKVNAKMAGIVATFIGLLAAPAIMARDGWNDHNRARRYTSHDFAFNYLNSCAPNAILFTNGDNDTFPLWYAQEVEGCRTDVRVVNLSLFNTDWYIDQMRRKAYDSDAIPMSMSADKYIGDVRNYVTFYDRNLPGPVNLREFVDFMSSDDPQAKVQLQNGESINYFPSKSLRLPVDTNLVKINGTVSKELAKYIVPALEWKLDKNFLMKGDIAMLDLLASNNWKRPIYFAVTVGSENYMGLEDYFQLEGLAYRLVPIKNPAGSDGQNGRVLSDIMYNNMMTKFLWGNMNDPKVYLDENNLRMTWNLRNNFARLAEQLIVENKRDSALKVLDKCMEVMPENTVPFNVFMMRIAEMYYGVGIGNQMDPASITTSDIELGKYSKAIETGNSIVKKIADVYENDLQYYFSLKNSYAIQLNREAQQAMAVMQELIRVSRQAKQEVLAKALEERFSKLQAQYSTSAYAK